MQVHARGPSPNALPLVEYATDPAIEASFNWWPTYGT